MPGTLNHMPGHIYVLCRQYEQAKVASEKAIRANDLYLNYTDEPTYYHSSAAATICI